MVSALAGLADLGCIDPEEPYAGPADPNLVGNAGLVVAITAAHTGALVLAGGLLAFLTYRIVGLSIPEPFLAGPQPRMGLQPGTYWALGLWSAL